VIILAVILRLVYKILNSQQDHQSDIESTMAIIYATFSALWGTLSVVCAKLLALLLEFQSRIDDNIFSHWFTWVIFAFWLVLMSYWLYRLNAALGLYSAQFIIPLLQANFIFFAIVSGGIYFQEFNYMKPEQWAGFSCGVIFMFLGIYLLVPPKEDNFGVVMPDVLEKQLSVHRLEDVNMLLSRGNSVVRSFTNFISSGVGRINRQGFDIMALSKKLENLKSKKNLTDDEAILSLIIEKVVKGALKTLKWKEEYLKIMKSEKRDDRRINNLKRTIEYYEPILLAADNVIECRESLIRESEGAKTTVNIDQNIDVFESALALLPDNWTFRTLCNTVRTEHMSRRLPRFESHEIIYGFSLDQLPEKSKDESCCDHKIL